MEFRGDSIEEMFTSAGEGLFSEITYLERVDCRECFDINVEGMDLEDLLVCWLRELLYLHQVKRILLKKFEITHLSDSELKARVWGEKFDQRRHTIKREIKAATYHDLKVQKRNGTWTARVIFDV